MLADILTNLCQPTVGSAYWSGVLLGRGRIKVDRTVVALNWASTHESTGQMVQFMAGVERYEGV